MDGQKSSQQIPNEKEKTNTEDGEKVASKSFHPKKKFLKEYQSESRGNCAQSEEIQTIPTCSKKKEEVDSINEKCFSISSCLGKIVETEINKYEDKEQIDGKKQFLPLLSKFDNMESSSYIQNKSDLHCQKFPKKMTDDRFEKSIFNASSTNIPLSGAFEIRNLQLQSQLQHELQQQQLLQYQLQLGIQNNPTLLSRELPTVDLINDNEIQRPGQLLTDSPNHNLDEPVNSFIANKIITHQNNLNTLKYNTDSNYNVGMQHYTNKLGERYCLNDSVEQTNSPKIRFNDMSNTKPKQSHTAYSTYDKPSSLLSSSSSSHTKFNIPNLNLDESQLTKLTSEDYYRMLKHQPEQQLVQQQQQHHDRIIRFHPSPDPYNSPHPPFLSSSSSASSSSSSRVRPTSDEVPMDLSVKRTNSMVYQNFNNNTAGSKKMRIDLNNYESFNNSNNNNVINVINNGIKIINHGNIVNSNEKQNIRSFMYPSPDSDKNQFKESTSYPKRGSSQEFMKKPKEHVNDNQPYHLPFKQGDIGLKNKHRNNVDNFNMFKGNDFDHYQDMNFQKNMAIKSNKYDQTALLPSMIMKPHDAPQMFQNRLVTLHNSQEHLNSVSSRNHLPVDSSRHRSFNPQNDSSSPSSIPFLLPISPLGNQLQQQQQYFDTQSFSDDSSQIQQKFQCKICDSIHNSYRNFRIHFVKDHGMEPHPEHCFHLSKPAYPIGHSRNFYKGHSDNIGTNAYHLAQKQVAEVTPMVAKVPAMPVSIPATVSALIQTDENNRTVVPIADIQTSESNRSLSRRVENREPTDGSRQESNVIRTVAKKTNLMSIFEGFEDVTDWRVHISSMHMIRSCSCKTCNRNFANAEELNKHLHNCHLDSMDFDVEYKCIYCSKAFTDDEVLFIHTREHEKLLCIAHIDQLSRENQVSNEIPMVPDTTCPEFENKCPSRSIVNNDSSSPNSESNLREITSKKRNSSSSNDDINANQAVVDQREIDNISHSSNDSDFMPPKKKVFLRKFQEEKKMYNDNISEKVDKSKSKVKKLNLPLELSPAKSHQSLRDQPQPSTSGYLGSNIVTARNIIDNIVNENLTKTSPPPTFKKMFPHFGIEEDSNPLTPNIQIAFTQSHLNALDQHLPGNNMNKCGVGLPGFKEDIMLEKNKNFNLKNSSIKQSVQQYQQQKHQPLSLQQPLLKDMLSQIKSPSSLSATSDPGTSSLGVPSSDQSKSKCVRDICDEIITHSFREDNPNGLVNDRLKILDSICFSNMKLEKRTSDSRSSTDTIITQTASKNMDCENVFEEDANSNINNIDDNGDTVDINTNATTGNSVENYNSKPNELENVRSTSGSEEDEIRINKTDDVDYSV